MLVHHLLLFKILHFQLSTLISTNQATPVCQSFGLFRRKMMKVDIVSDDGVSNFVTLTVRSVVLTDLFAQNVTTSSTSRCVARVSIMMTAMYAEACSKIRSAVSPRICERGSASAYSTVRAICCMYTVQRFDTACK